MKIKKTKNTTQVWISSNETFKWARRPNAQWPCSTLADRRIFVELASNGDLVDIKINGKNPKNNIDSHELNSLLNNLIKRKK